MLQAFSYYFNSFKNPGFRDFIEMGYGIKARYRRSEKYWSKHLQLCKNFQQAAISEYKGDGRLAILGAGTLLDINLELISEKFSELDLYDADISLRNDWNRKVINFPANANYNFTDLTGMLELWTSRLNSYLKSNRKNPDLAQILNSLNPDEVQIFREKPDIIFSINLLSQIPIYWRDRVHKLAKKICNIDTDMHGLYSDAVQRALENSMSKLQMQHLKLLSDSGAEYIILISDRDFLYYKADSAAWQTEKALYIDREISINNYKVVNSDSWFWHIAPQGLEYRDYGCIHDVAAYAFKRQDADRKVN